MNFWKNFLFSEAEKKDMKKDMMVVCRRKKKKISFKPTFPENIVGTKIFWILTQNCVFCMIDKNFRPEIFGGKEISVIIFRSHKKIFINHIANSPSPIDLRLNMKLGLRLGSSHVSATT